jgi:hypothetical protein
MESTYELFDLAYSLNEMDNFIKANGEEAYIDAVYHGAFSDLYMSILHPSDTVRSNPNFDTYFKAFKNAYV